MLTLCTDFVPPYGDPYVQLSPRSHLPAYVNTYIMMCNRFLYASTFCILNLLNFRYSAIMKCLQANWWWQDDHLFILWLTKMPLKAIYREHNGHSETDHCKSTGCYKVVNWRNYEFVWSRENSIKDYPVQSISGPQFGIPTQQVSCI